MNPTLTADTTEENFTLALSRGSSAVGQAVLAGLCADPKYLPSWLFYDTAGSQLFEEITGLPEYYLTRLEHSIFVQHARAIIATAAGIGPEAEDLCVLELGAGSANKTLVLLRALMERQGHALYLPVDVSEAALQWAMNNVHAALPAVQVESICSEFTQGKSLDLPKSGRRLALYIGSSIGNFDPDDAVKLLQWLRSQLCPGDALLLGTDMVKDAAPLLAAYNDRSGVTAAFNKNVLARLNRELGADFRLEAFEHRAVWNACQRRIEMHLYSKCDQTMSVDVLGRTFHLRRGESIHTENSYKFTAGSVSELLQESGFSLERSWYYNSHWFGVHLARVVDSATMLDDDAEDAAA